MLCVHVCELYMCMSYMHVHLYVCAVRAYVCVCAGCVCVYMCVLCVSMCACVHAVYECVHMCVHALYACVHVCGCCVCTRAPVCMRASTWWEAAAPRAPGLPNRPAAPGLWDTRPAVPLSGAAAGGRPGSPQSAGSSVRGRVHVRSPACGRPPNCWLFHPQPLGISAEGAGRQADPPCDRDPRKPQAEGTRPWKCRSWVSAAVPRACTQISEDGG